MADYFYTGVSCFNETTFEFSSTTLFSIADFVLVKEINTSGVKYIDNCIEITNVDTVGNVTSSFEGSYEICEDCLSAVTSVIELIRCRTDEIFYVTYNSFITNYGIYPLYNEYYYITFNYLEKQITDCFKIGQVYKRDKKPNLVDILTTPISGTDCNDCPTGGIVYYYIGNPCSYPGPGVPTIYFSSNTNYDEVGFITYTDSDGIDQFCGVIKQQSTIPPAGDEIFLIAILGNKSNCNECLSQVAKKRIIYECLNPENYQVVWSSVLFEAGDSTSIVYRENNTCYTIGPETEEEVTITDFAEFTPTPTCEDCLQCSGFYMELKDTNCDVSGEPFWVQSFSYIPIGNFINVLGVCYEVTNYSQLEPSPLAPGSIYSTPNFTTCEECTSSTFNFWYATGCTDGNDYYVFTNTGFNPGDIVQILYGSSPYKCVELVYPDPPIRNGTSFYYSPTTTPYTSCESCQQNKISVTIIDCEETNQFYVTMSLNTYETILNTSPVFLVGTKCYRMLNECPLIDTYDNFNPNYYFNNCIDCNSPLRIGVENEVCVQICTESGTTVTSVIPPHPTWSNQYGKDILEMSMVVIGGNGLNS